MPRSPVVLPPPPANVLPMARPPNGLTPPPTDALQPDVLVKGSAATIGPIQAEAGGPRVVLYGVESFGKTSTAASAPNPVILMARGETGAMTLRGAGLIPDTAGAIIDSWSQLLATLDSLIADRQAFQTLALDALIGFERLCHEHIAVRDFGGDMGPHGFLNYHKGYDVAITDWLAMLARLDELRARQGMTILVLGHAQIKPFRNPIGEDFDVYAPDCHAKTWGATAKWADAVFFGNFISVVDKESPKARKGKGIGGTVRVIYTQHADAYWAKNRYGMQPWFQLPADPAQNWTTIANAIRGEYSNA